jgi:hypothetical protein
VTVRRVVPSLRLSIVLAAFALLAVEPLRAQTIRGGSGGGERRGWSRVRVAKWALLGAAVGFGTYALTQSRKAEDAYASLRQLCRAEPQGCDLSAGGVYPSPQAEYLYQTALYRDRRARVGIFGGQVALLGSVGLFIYDLGTPRGPVNIPYPGGAGAFTPTPQGAGTRSLGLGVRLAY